MTLPLQLPLNVLVLIITILKITRPKKMVTIMTDKCTGLPWHQQRQVHNRCRMSHTHFCCISAAGSVSAGVGRGAHKQVDLAPWIKPFAQHRCTWWQQHRQVDIFVTGNLPVPSTGVPVDNNTGQLFSFDIGSLPRNITVTAWLLTLFLTLPQLAD